MDQKHKKQYTNLVNGLNKLGLDVTEKVLHALDFGVPQTRRRVILSALRKDQGYTVVVPKKRKGHSKVSEAIGGLKTPVFFDRKIVASQIPVHPNHWTMQPKSERFKNPNGSFPKGRSFKRLEWDKASPTIAFGNREIHVHPSGTRRLSIYEAMLLQGFPSKFILQGTLTEQVEQISNAVPPPLARSVAAAVKRSLQGE